MTSPAYVLITAARNEAPYIGLTLDSVLAQTVLPKRWIIVSDGSTDGTDAIVQRRISGHDFASLVRLESGSQRGDFASKVHALRHAVEQLEGIDFEFLGNLDADVSFESTYFETLLRRMALRPRLGIAGGFIHEEQNGSFRSRHLNEPGYVAGAVQTFRRQCYLSLEGYTPMRYGGEDTLLVFSARMNGWDVEAFPDLIVRHHKQSKGLGGKLRTAFRYGASDHQLGSHFAFVLVKSIKRFADKPYALGGLAHLCGFLWSSMSLPKRGVTREFAGFYRLHQRTRLRSLLSFGNFKESRK